MCSRGDIENLLYEYQERIDAGDLPGVAAMFADAVIRAEGTDVAWTGEDEILAMYAGFVRMYNGSPRTTHTNLNPIIHIDEDANRATCRSRYVVYQQTNELALQPIITGGYHDVFERVDGAWRFAERVMITHSLGDMTKHQIGLDGQAADGTN